jgi:AAT family amino acid transporter
MTNAGTQTQPDRPTEHVKQVKREEGLSSRHIQFIALGGAIGTGLFLGSGKSISMAGPSVILQYIICGLFVFIMVRAVGEFMYKDPSQHTFITSIGRYVGHGWGTFSMWTYWLVLLFVGMTEITAVAEYFVTFFALFGINLAQWRWLIEIIAVALLLTINLASARLFGETEFWFSMFKVTLIMCMIVTGIVMVAIDFHYPAAHVGGVYTPAGHATLANLFSTSLAPRGWEQFAASFGMVFFAYTTIEQIGVTITETKEPRKVLPSAVNQLMIRAISLYALAVAAILAIVPWHYFRSAADGSFSSPFIMVFQYAGVKWASALVFFVVITAAASSLNSLLFSAGRQLHAVALDSLRAHPRSSSSGLMTRLTSLSARHVPTAAVSVSALLILIAPLLSLIPGSGSLFVLFSSTGSAAILFIYVLVMIAHWNYCHSDDYMSDGFLLRGWKVLDPLAIVFFVFVYITLFLDSTTLIPAILGLLWLAIFGTVCCVRASRQEKSKKSEIQE